MVLMKWTEDVSTSLKCLSQSSTCSMSASAELHFTAQINDPHLWLMSVWRVEPWGISLPSSSSSPFRHETDAHRERLLLTTLPSERRHQLEATLTRRVPAWKSATTKKKIQNPAGCLTEGKSCYCSASVGNAWCQGQVSEPEGDV